MKIEYARTLQLPNRLFHLRINSTFMRHHEYASISFNDEYPYASTISRPKLSLFSIHRRTGSTTTKRFLEGNERTEKRNSNDDDIEEHSFFVSNERSSSDEKDPHLNQL
ncbi:uncharacterized protein OCT59_022325 [Rhizophagus irregularis]|uniref:uncharacterized protein n=1 Tax=Rhizophagus irregularis TaxID=588596 RepID=UPI000CC8BB50|nr:hypothetical protein OCT59_022325 [Rhizophagus irregularis]GBC52153.1 hypothetical protein RIR_jg37029.t1 [Rhizophagus irregularis DAOM 181602=DAOM 197198]